MKRRKHNTGGSAFPVPDDASDIPGMTLRDYFAAHAMQAIIITAKDPDSEEMTLFIGDYAYQVADFMLDARDD